MQIYRSLTEIPAAFGPTVATIGNFDGVHLGHRWVIAEVIACARARNARSLAITFEPHPIRVLRPEVPLRLITPFQQRLDLLAATGLDAVIVLPFTRELSLLSARQFATDVLRNALQVVEVHEGENFRFGHDAEAGANTLEQFGRDLGFAVHIYTPAPCAASPSPPAAFAPSSPRVTFPRPALFSAAASPSTARPPQAAATGPNTPSPPSISRLIRNFFPPTASTPRGSASPAKPSTPSATSAIAPPSALTPSPSNPTCSTSTPSLSAR